MGHCANLFGVLCRQIKTRFGLAMIRNLRVHQLMVTIHLALLGVQSKVLQSTARKLLLLVEMRPGLSFDCGGSAAILHGTWPTSCLLVQIFKFNIESQAFLPANPRSNLGADTICQKYGADVKTIQKTTRSFNLKISVS